MLAPRICPICGSNEIKDVDGILTCRFCDTKLDNDTGLNEDDVKKHVRVETAEAYLKETPPKFDTAEELFFRLIKDYPDWSVPYWGYLRAKYGIKYYYDDYDDVTIPVCYLGDYYDFTKDPYYLKALECAESEELKNKYISEADRIAKCFREYQKKVKNEDYDVFISFKDHETNSDRKTSDSKKMKELYDYLSSKGLKVFFSPVSMMDYVGEPYYDVYIVNAINTSEAMILFGSKEEYFETPWIKNEWSRFIKSISLKNKKNNSLLVVGHNVNYNLLPHSLRHRQAYDIKGVDNWKEEIYQRVLKIITPEKEDKYISKEELDRLLEERAAEKRKIEEQERLENLKRLEEEKRKAEELKAKAEEEQRKAEELKAKLEQEKREAEAKKAEEERIKSEKEAEEKRLAEEKKKEEELKPSLPEVKVEPENIYQKDYHGEEPIFTEDKKSFFYGMYPSDVITDESLIEELKKLRIQNGAWRLHNGVYYFKAKSEKYYSFKNAYFNKGAELQLDTTYWFICKPIKWNIIKSDHGVFTAVCADVIDSTFFNGTYENKKDGAFANNYAKSKMREWLNNDFCGKAFALNSSSLLNIEVDNTDDNNQYSSTDTNDLIFLLTSEDYNNKQYGFTSNEDRLCNATDYAIFKGIAYNKRKSSSRYASYWTRTPNSEDSTEIVVVGSNGDLTKSVDVHHSEIGVRPAIVLVTKEGREYLKKQESKPKNNKDSKEKETLAKPENNIDPYKPRFTDDGKFVYFGMYPQTIVSDEKILKELNKMKTPRVSGPYKYENDTYWCVRTGDDSSDRTFSNKKRITAKTLFWFKYEPIKWIVYEKDKNNCWLVSERILDSQRFYRSILRRQGEKGILFHKKIYSNNYEKSDIRPWLNGPFLTAAFSKGYSYIVEAHVYNDFSTSDGKKTNSKFLCNDTNDKVYLLSYKSLSSRIKNSKIRAATMTDYAKVMVLKTCGSTWEINYTGDTYFTRSPYTKGDSYGATLWAVNSGGGLCHTSAYYTNGIRPAIVIKNEKTPQKAAKKSK